MIITWLIAQGACSFVTGMGKQWLDFHLTEKKAEREFLREKERVKWQQEQSDPTKAARPEPQAAKPESSLAERDKAWYAFLAKHQTPEDAGTRSYLAIFIMALVVLLGAYIGFAFYTLNIAGDSMDKTVKDLLVNYSHFVMFLTVTTFDFYYGARTSSEILNALLPGTRHPSPPRSSSTH